MLKIENLHADVAGEPILKGLNLEIKAGEVHCIMGPNGSGKSTLAQVLAGRDSFNVSQGSVTYQGKDLLAMEPHQRACEGVFLAFQYPHEIPGVSGLQFLRAAVNAQRTFRGEEELDAFDLMQLLKQKAAEVNISTDDLKRAVNQGFSGGEKKRNEMLQMSVLEPAMVVLDEVDSGLDIDALKVVADAVNRLRDPRRSFLVITHYQRLLDYIVPDRVHVLVNGRIAKSGNKELALELEDRGYTWVEEQRVGS